MTRKKIIEAALEGEERDVSLEHLRAMAESAFSQMAKMHKETIDFADRVLDRRLTLADERARNVDARARQADRSMRDRERPVERVREDELEEIDLAPERFEHIADTGIHPGYSSSATKGPVPEDDEL